MHTLILSAREGDFIIMTIYAAAIIVSILAVIRIGRNLLSRFRNRD